MADNNLPKTEFKRQTAYKCSIGELQKGTFVKKPGWESNYLMTEHGDFSRVNIIALVIDKGENSIVIDDGTGQLSARMFENTQMLSGISIGDIVLIIGRPREFNEQIYLTLEIAKKVNDPEWIAYRKKELSLITKVRDMSAVKAKPPEPKVVENPNTMNSKDKLLKTISQLDTGSGASVDDVIMISKVSNAETFLQDMIMRGEIFEVKPGKYKMM